MEAVQNIPVQKDTTAEESSTKLDLSSLNPAQLQAVEHNSGPLLIFAAAGSGKTRVLTYRIAKLIEDGLAHPSQILAVTFTNKAAKEMKKRVAALLSRDRPGEESLSARALQARESAKAVWVSTFHSTCARILRHYGSNLGYTHNFAIYDTKDSLAVIKQAMKRLKIDPKRLTPKSVLKQIERAKHNYKDPEAFREEINPNDSTSEQIAELYSAYQAELLAANAMDFGDLLCNTLSLLLLNKDVLESLQNKFRYIHVDEYQDTNKVQYELVRLLAKRDKNLCVVGDDDQSIYAFRGATIENILSFQRDYPEAQVITLDTNYRSTGNILKAANSVIEKNKRRQAKKMRTDRGDGELLKFLPAEDEQEEADIISREILALHQQGIPYDDVAIFYRTNSQSRAIEEGLCRFGIPYTIFGGLRFYDRREIKDILGYYRLILNPNDNQAFLRIVNTPTRGIGATTIAGIIADADKESIPYLEALKAKAKLATKAAAKLASFAEIIDSLSEEALLIEAKLSNKNEANEDAIAELIQSIGVKSGYMKNLKDENTEESLSRIDNIWELCSVAVDFIRHAYDNEEEPSLGSFLERTSLVSDLDKENTRQEGDSEKKTNGVSLMTLHLAKGLEFEAAFLTGMEDGLLPHIRSFDSIIDMEEERRLCYVGITRAKTKLYLSKANFRTTFGKTNYYSGSPSRFLDSIPGELVEGGFGFL